MRGLQYIKSLFMNKIKNRRKGKKKWKRPLRKSASAKIVEMNLR